MTIQSKATLRGKFEDGDVPQGSNYADFFDSFVHKTDSTAQSVTSKITLNQLNVTTVSAATIYADLEKVTTVSAGTIHAGSMVVAPAPYGGLFIVDSTVTTTGTAETYTDVLMGESSAFALSSEFSTSAESFLKYVGASTTIFKAEVDLSTYAAASTNATFALARNGTPVTASEMDMTLGTGFSPATLHGVVSMGTGDQLNLIVKAGTTASSSITVNRMTMSAIPITRSV